MPRANPLQAAFNAGEIGPRLAARVDFPKYRNAGARVENMTPLPQGGLTRRPGTRFVAAAADQEKRPRLVPFEFSTDQAYVLEAGDGKFRFFRDKGQIVVQPTDAAIINGDFSNGLTNWDDRSTGGGSIVVGPVTRTISRTLGTAIGNMTVNGGLAAAFDGSISQSTQTSAARSALSGYVGKNWGAGNKKTIAAFTCYGTNDAGYVLAANPTTTLTLQGSSDNFSADIKTLGSKTFTDTSNESGIPRSLTSGIDTSTAYQYHRIVVTGASGAAVYMAELQWSELAPNPLNGCQLVGNGSGIAWVEQEVPTSHAGSEHVVAFRVHGVAGTKALLSIGTTSTGGELVADVECSVGWHVVAFTPTVTPFFLQFKNPNGYTISVDEISVCASGAASPVPLKLGTPYSQSILEKIKWAQSADVMYVAHPDHPPYKLERRGHTTWSFSLVGFDEGPFLDQNTDAGRRLTCSATTGNGITITAIGHAPFEAGDVGRFVRLQPSGEPGWAVITGFDSTQSVTADVKRGFSSTVATANWSLGAWSAGRGFPSVVSFFEQRLVWAATKAQPQSFWMSQSGDLENMRPDSFVGGAVEVQDDDGLDFTIAADEVNAIRWMSPGRQLILGTSGGEWSVTSDGPVVTPLDVEVKRESTNGSADIQPLRISSIVLFVQRARRKLREFVFSLESDGFRTPDLTILAEHITESGLREIVYQQEPDSQVHCVREDGVLATLTYQRDQDVVGWSRHIFGGSYQGGAPVVESVATIPGSAAAGSQNRDEAWIAVKRTVNGTTFRSIEVMEASFEGPNPEAFDNIVDFDAAVLARQRAAFYVDCGLSYDGAPTQTLAGLGHLEGETVTILADGALHPDRIVAGGAVTLQAPASVIHVGLPYRHVFASLKLEAGAAAGTAVGKVKRVHGIALVLLHSLGLRIGPSIGRLEDVSLREVGNAMDTAVPLFTGERFVSFEGDFERDARIVISGDAPLPFTLLAAAPELKTNELI
ncbi:hypothetical protein AAFN88_12815 [Pelagibius sp. CAU 1746]|uniref:hypothetical protein n=1 Tax=Pelagibius sp. CAU 1746 TaxID=3140370 RepID=UPI00325B8C92